MSVFWLEPSSLMAQQDAYAAELDEAQEVLRVVLPARNQAAVVVKPDEEPLDLSAPLGAPKRSAVRCGRAPIASMGGD